MSRGKRRIKRRRMDRRGSRGRSWGSIAVRIGKGDLSPHFDIHYPFRVLRHPRVHQILAFLFSPSPISSQRTCARVPVQSAGFSIGLFSRGHLSELHMINNILNSLRETGKIADINETSSDR